MVLGGVDLNVFEEMSGSFRKFQLARNFMISPIETGGSR
jgi:hypothetical protein